MNPVCFTLRQSEYTNKSLCYKINRKKCLQNDVLQNDKKYWDSYPPDQNSNASALTTRQIVRVSPFHWMSYDDSSTVDSTSEILWGESVESRVVSMMESRRGTRTVWEAYLWDRFWPLGLALSGDNRVSQALNRGAQWASSLSVFKIEHKINDTIN